MSDHIEIRLIRQAPHLNIEYEGVCVVKNFSELDDDVGDHQESPRFFTGRNDKYEWAFDIFAHGYDHKNLEHVGIRFYIMNEFEVNLEDLAGLRFTASIIDEDGRKYTTKSAPFQNAGPYCSLFKDFVLRETLLKKCKLLPDGDLTIAFKMSFDASNAEEETSLSQKNPLKAFGKVLDDSKYTDFTFIVEGKEFNVHRAILATRSPVFEAMFDSQMRESNEGKVDIVDVETKVMEKLLRFVYVGEVGNFENLTDKVLRAAEKYQIDELKQLCEKVLLEQLSLDNVYEILRIADENNAENLKKKGLEFFHYYTKKLSSDVNFKAHLRSLPQDLKVDLICLLIDKP